MLQSYIVTKCDDLAGATMLAFHTACYGRLPKIARIGAENRPKSEGGIWKLGRNAVSLHRPSETTGQAPRPRHPSSGKAPPKLLKADTEASESRHEAADEPMTATEAADEAMTRRDGGGNETEVSARARENQTTYY